MSRTNIILTGFMGCGKSTVGKMLAKELKYDFVDTDQLIEKRCGLSIQEIFAAKGESAFRDMESNIANELSEKEGLIIATGGGMMLNPTNINALRANGLVFCLVATPEEILARVSGDNLAKRPLLDSAEPLERIKKLIQERENAYRQFMQIDTSGKNTQEVTEDLITIFQATKNR